MKTAGIVAALLIIVAVVVFFALRRNPDDGSETFTVDGMKVTVGPAKTMSGPEFLKMLEEQGGESDPNVHGLYIRIPDPVSPLERGEKYEDPLDDMLAENDLGEVTGGGTMMNADNSIKYVGVDISVHDVEKSLPLIAAKLREIGAPKGTVIEYGDDEAKEYHVWEER